MRQLFVDRASSHPRRPSDDDGGPSSTPTTLGPSGGSRRQVIVATCLLLSAGCSPQPEPPRVPQPEAPRLVVEHGSATESSPVGASPPMVDRGTKRVERPRKLAPVIADGHIVWTDYTPDVLTKAQAAGRPVFLVICADWALDCKANMKVFIDVPKVHQALSETTILPVKADLTRSDPAADDLLQKLGRKEVPVYAMIHPDGHWEVLPQVVAMSTFVSAFRDVRTAHPKQDHE